jgi:hypothetical protein
MSGSATLPHLVTKAYLARVEAWVVGIEAMLPTIVVGA